MMRKLDDAAPPPFDDPAGPRRAEARAAMTRPRARFFVAAGLAGAAWFGSATDAGAYCRSRTCGKDCTTDEFTCPIEGLPLAWRRRCASYSLQRGDLPTISHDELRVASEAAFQAWRQVDCAAGALPSMTVLDPFGVSACGRVEYNARQANANVVVLRDTWDDEEGRFKVLGLTTVTYSTSTGEILDADIEINGLMPISGVHPGPGQYDLQSILTHEVGHFLGLTHSHVGLDDQCRDGATMCPTYDPGSEDFRTLADDDIAGICEIYPPDRDAPPNCDPTPLRGFSPECGLDPISGGSCAVSAATPSGRDRSIPFAVAAVGFALCRLRRRVRS
jgi:hypothetical protein